MAGASKPVDVSTKQQRIAQLARQSPEMGFTSLAYYIDLDWLTEAFDRTRGEDAPPSDKDPLYTDEEITGFQREPSPDTSVPREELACALVVRGPNYADFVLEAVSEQGP